MVQCSFVAIAGSSTIFNLYAGFPFSGFLFPQWSLYDYHCTVEGSGIPVVPYGPDRSVNPLRKQHFEEAVSFINMAPAGVDYGAAYSACLQLNAAKRKQYAPGDYSKN
jgi:hypothetical protein